MIMAIKQNIKSLKKLFVVLFVVLLVSQFSSQFLYQQVKPSTASLVDKVALPSLLGSMATVSVVPLFEEWLFREKCLFFLKKYFSSTVSVLISALVFSFIHGQLYFVPFFLGGIIYGVARLYSRKWWFPVILHASYNGFALAITYLGVIL